MTDTSRAPRLDRERIRDLFDLRKSFLALTGGTYEADPYPRWHELREQAPVHEGTLHALTGFDGEAFWHGLPYPDARHFTAFSWEAVDAAHRNDSTFSSTPFDQQTGVLSSMLTMGGAEHRRYRSLVQPSFMPAKARWWIERWIDDTVHGLIDSFVEEGRAELNVDFCAAIPILTITGSFGIPIDQALDLRAAMHEPGKLADAVAELIALRRDDPQDDLITVLLEAELADEHGTTHRLSDEEIQGFAQLLLTAGSGTTWKQMGITLAALLQRPEVLAEVTADRALLRSAIEESVRWMPTDPMFSRWVAEDTELCGTAVPAGSVVHLCLGAANRDPARWERPDEYDVHRPLKPSVGFGGGPHICLGMHVARAEMLVGIGALLDRLPNLRLDPDAEPPQAIGLYERGVTAIPVRFDT
jgi:cytochrome P450